MKRPTPFAKLGNSLDRLAPALSSVSVVKGAVVGGLQGRIAPILSTPPGVMNAARTAVEPAGSNEAQGTIAPVWEGA